jgi:hypothetical protein
MHTVAEQVYPSRHVPQPRKHSFSVLLPTAAQSSPDRMQSPKLVHVFVQ